jgi:hypothetical protein
VNETNLPYGYARDAVIFIHGLGDKFLEQSGENIARRIGKALNVNAKTAEAQFSVEPGRPEQLEVGDERFNLECYTITRTDPAGKAAPVLDLYDFDHKSILTRNHKDANTIVRFFRLLRTIIPYGARVFRAIFFERGVKRSRREKLQLAVVILLFLLGSTYFLILLAGISETVLQQIPDEASTGIRGAMPVLAYILKVSQIVVVGLAAIDLLSAKLARRVKEDVPEAAIEYLGAADYISFDEDCKRNILGLLGQALDRIAEQEAVNHRHIHILAYSFGSIMALDGMFQTQEPPRSFELVHTLITVGCPYDFVRFLWPKYFANRKSRPGKPERWINVYTPIDFLGSRFRNDQEGTEPQLEAVKELGIFEQERLPENISFGEPEKQRLGIIATLFLASFQAHATYWSPHSIAAQSCFDPIVRHMYGGDAVLS